MTSILGHESAPRGLAPGGKWPPRPAIITMARFPLLIPFGVWGLAAFVWLLVAGARFLYTNFRDGAPELRRINGFLLALFLARILIFIFVFGTLSGDLVHFLGILGLSVALNVRGQRPARPGEATKVHGRCLRPTRRPEI